MGHNWTGTTTSGTDTPAFENSFFMLAGDKAFMLEAIKKVLIQGCMDVAKLAVSDFSSFEKFMWQNGGGTDRLNQRLPQIVYGMYAKLFSYFYISMRQLTLGRYTLAGFEKFGADIEISEFFVPGSFHVLERNKLEGFIDLHKRWIIPTKPISLPTAKKLYYTCLLYTSRCV